MLNPSDTYLLAERSFVAKHRLDLTSHASNTIIKANSPFELQPAAANPKNALLLIHGLLDSPFAMRDLGLFYQQQGFLTRAMRLPGHGTQAEHLLHVDYRDWLAAAKQNIAHLANHCDNIYIAGHSTGASVALYHALQDTRIKGLFLFAPALKIRSPFIDLAYGLKTISLLTKRAAWVRRKPEADYARYRSCPINAGLQVHKLSLVLRRLLKRQALATPQFWVLSADDETVCSKTSLQQFEQTTHPDSRLILYGNEQKTLNDTRIEIRSSCYPEKNIIDFSHNCLAIAPENSHYGEHSGYLDLQHYGEKKLKQQQGKKPCFGASTMKNLQHNFLARLAYNPDFSGLKTAMSEFLNNVL